ncbi:protein trichome birefringence [Phtheirospermum japonicum]|uniref:Protein trichome birefringence n=1 Tax=Phtheirospermum japonicum TaxID=374723 RepID=A0A830BXY9_9LAMI|nr:protein trichome birefringence [Phtheirospermum japonicum]
MADITKYAPINGGAVFSDFKTHFSILRTKRTVTIAYVFVFIFIAFTIFLAFSPSSNSSSPWFTNIFTISATRSSNIANSAPSSSVFTDESYRSHFSSIYNYFFPNSSAESGGGSQNSNFSPPPSLSKNQAHKVEPLKSDNITNLPQKPHVNQTVSNNTNPPKPTPEMQNQTQNKAQGEKFRDKVGVLKGNSSVADKGIKVNNNSSPSVKKKQSNGTNLDMAKRGSDDDLIKSLMNCDFFDGNWVKDESYPLYKPDSCSLIDEQFNCFRNGRPDNGYYKLKWKPKGCTLPRLDGGHMLKLLRGKRLVFVGDSLNRNMWESLICILRNSVKNQKKVYEENGRHHFRGEASYSFVFEDYKFTVEFFVTPFLVQEWEVAEKNGTKKETLRLDIVSHAADKYKNADIIVFNTGHWWTHEKTALGGGQWNSGGQCDHETEPIKNETYLTPYPPKMAVLEKVLKNMKTRVTYLNVTRMTDYRKDGHPSIYRKQHLSDEERRSPLSFQDCSHWCLPGVPDAWNEILYAEILVKMNQKRQQKRT